MTHAGRERSKMCKYFHLPLSFGSINIYTQGELFFFKFQLFVAQPCWFALYQSRAEKDWFMTFSHFYYTHFGLVYDVSDTDRWAHYDSTDGRVFATFRRRFLTNMT